MEEERETIFEIKHIIVNVPTPRALVEITNV